MIPRTRPYLDLSDILNALRPGVGRDAFETAVAARVGARYAIAFAYGHSGMIASLRALNLTGSEIILPAYTCLVMADSVVNSGNRPVFVDIDLSDYNMSLAGLKSALTSKTRAVIATHMYGYPTNVDAIREICDDQILVIEDRALGFLSSTSGNSDLRGDIGLFSFGPTKHMFTVEGGVIVTNSPALYEKIKVYRDRQMNYLPASVWFKRWIKLVLNLRKPSSSSEPSGPSPATKQPSNSSIIARDYATAYTNFQARVGLSQLRKLNTILNKRESLAKYYDSELQGIPDLIPAPIIPGANYSHYSIRVEQRDKINFSQQMRRRGVDVGQMYDRVLPFRERFKAYASTSYPNTEKTTREIVNLPLYPNLTPAEAQHIVKCTREILRSSR